MPDDAILLSLTEKETQAAFRSLLEYRRLLKFSELRDSGAVFGEIEAVDSLSHKISLAYHYPAGERNVVEA